MKQVVLDSKYNGRYIAIKDFENNVVIADGKDPKEAYEIAVKKGYVDPVILYVPVKNTVQIY